MCLLGKSKTMIFLCGGSRLTIKELNSSHISFVDLFKILTLIWFWKKIHNTYFTENNTEIQ